MSAEELKSLPELNKALKENKKVVVDFFASWCGPCKKMAPVLDALEKEYKDIKFFKVDVDESDDIVQKYGVDCMPTFVFFKDGEEFSERVKGANEDKFKERVEELNKEN